MRENRHSAHCLNGHRAERFTEDDVTVARTHRRHFNRDDRQTAPKRRRRQDRNALRATRLHRTVIHRRTTLDGERYHRRTTLSLLYRIIIASDGSSHQVLTRDNRRGAPRD